MALCENGNKTRRSIEPFPSRADRERSLSQSELAVQHDRTNLLLRTKLEPLPEHWCQRAISLRYRESRSTKPAYIGVDVSKERLDVLTPGKSAALYPNDKAGIACLCRTLKHIDGEVSLAPILKKEGVLHISALALSVCSSWFLLDLEIIKTI